MARFLVDARGFLESLWGAGAGSAEFWIIAGVTLLATYFALSFLQSMFGVTLTEAPRTVVSLLFGAAAAVSAMTFASTHGAERTVVWAAGGAAVLLLAVPFYKLLHRPKWGSAIVLWILVSAVAVGASLLLDTTLDAIHSGEKKTAPAAEHRKQIEQMLNQ